MVIKRRMDKENVEYYLAGKKNNIMKFAHKWMELAKKVILSEVTQPQKDKYDIC